MPKSPAMNSAIFEIFEIFGDNGHLAVIEQRCSKRHLLRNLPVKTVLAITAIILLITTPWYSDDSYVPTSHCPTGYKCVTE